MTKEELVDRLIRLRDMTINEHRLEDGEQPYGEAEQWANGNDPEEAHKKADAALLAFINDADVSTAFLALHRWYA